ATPLTVKSVAHALSVRIKSEDKSKSFFICKYLSLAKDTPDHWRNFPSQKREIYAVAYYNCVKTNFPIIRLIQISGHNYQSMFAGGVWLVKVMNSASKIKL
ncbi:MAG TPA: hypothetical protein PLP69_03585, partial [Bacteroidales bacterium]|nr:hypothetical protein [Bacteroidales bacterium]